MRHGETAWSLTGQHTGWTDLPLTAHGEAQARGLAARLGGMSFTHVLASPLQRARRTGELAGFGTSLALDAELVEWNYGDYEGRTLAEIQHARPGWELFRDGCPGGESAVDISERVDRVIARIGRLEGGVILFSSGHLLRVLAARWLEASPSLGRGLVLDPASVCKLGYDHGRSERVIRLWNDSRPDSG